MIPILYSAGENKFDTNGLGSLSEAVSCTITEERNGLYELEMTYPVIGKLYNEIKISGIVMAVPGDGRESQPFRIYKISRPINGIITINAEHISYQLSHIPCSPFSAGTASEALEGLKSHAAEECPFDFWTDKSTGAAFTVSVPSSIRSRLGGIEGSILDIYGGEYEFDRYTVKLYNQRGRDNGVTLRYGKNITDLTQEENIESTVTGIYPYWTGSDGQYVELPEKVISAENAVNYPYPRTVPMDFSSDFEERPTEEQLREATKAYIKNNNIGVPSVSISVSFVALWQTEEYKDIAPLERAGLCDTVGIEFEKLGISAKAKVIKTVYNVILERYDSLELGEARSNLASTIANQQKELEEKTSSRFLQQAVNRATGWITGVNGGYVIFHKDGNGQPYEILIMDTPNISTAQNVWRWNQNGWGHSKTGYNGPYTTAATIDGGIVADFITAGQMRAERISGGTIEGEIIAKNLKMHGGSISIETSADSNFMILHGLNNLGALLTHTISPGQTTVEYEDKNQGTKGRVTVQGHLIYLEDLISKKNTSISSNDVETGTVWVDNIKVRYSPTSGYASGVTGAFTDANGKNISVTKGVITAIG